MLMITRLVMDIGDCCLWNDLLTSNLKADCGFLLRVIDDFSTGYAAKTVPTVRQLWHLQMRGMLLQTELETGDTPKLCTKLSFSWMPHNNLKHWAVSAEGPHQALHKYHKRG